MVAKGVVLVWSVCRRWPRLWVRKFVVCQIRLEKNRINGSDHVGINGRSCVHEPSKPWWQNKGNRSLMITVNLKSSSFVYGRRIVLLDCYVTDSLGRFGRKILRLLIVKLRVKHKFSISHFDIYSRDTLNRVRGQTRLSVRHVHFY